MWIRLAPQSHNLAPVELDAEQLPVSFGRSVHADITIGDALLSRTHCELTRSDDGFVIRDLESTNGTLVNGETVNQALLKPNDTVILGNARFVVAVGDDSANVSDVELVAVHDIDA
jgi:pSer/pThr/pTyr-binding forkhead associated (FHA) protein